MGPASAPGFIKFYLWRNISGVPRLRYFKGLKFLQLGPNMHYKCAGCDHVHWLIVSNVLNLFLDLSWHLRSSPGVIKFESFTSHPWPFPGLDFIPSPRNLLFLFPVQRLTGPVWCGTASPRLCSSGYHGDAEHVTLWFHKGLIGWDRKRKRRRENVMGEQIRQRNVCYGVCVRCFAVPLGSH